MEVCIFGVLTVNLLTFPSRNASLPSEMRVLPMLAKMAGWAWAEEKSKSPARARFTGLYDDWREA